MTRSFADFAKEQMTAWDGDTHKVHEAASAAFQNEMTERARLGALFREAREKRELSQNQLAELADIQQAEISRVERGVSNPTEATLIRVAAALQLRLTLEDAVAA